MKKVIDLLMFAFAGCVVLSVLACITIVCLLNSNKEKERAYQRGYTQGTINAIISERAKSPALYETHRLMDSVVFRQSLEKKIF